VGAGAVPGRCAWLGREPDTCRIRVQPRVGGRNPVPDMYAESGSGALRRALLTGEEQGPVDHDADACCKARGGGNAVRFKSLHLATGAKLMAVFT